MKVSLAGVEAWSPGMAPPPGSYLCRIDDVTEGTSRNGYPQIRVSWTVQGGEYNGAEIRDFIVVTDGTLGKVVALLEAIGCPIPPGEFDLDVATLKGGECVVVTREESYVGSDGQEKHTVRPVGYRRKDQVATAIAQAQTQQPAAQASAATRTDTDIPF